MSTLRRGWNNGGQARPASEIDIRYDHGLLKRESSKWPRYVAVTTPSAYSTAQPYLSREPAGVAHAAWLDWDHLQSLCDGLPNGAEMVVGLGGGRALDASKYVALTKGLPLVLVPTVVSTGAIIHGVFAKWDGRQIIRGGDYWPWVDCEEVLVDYGLVLEAPYYLNTAGLGDVLSSYAGVAEWRRNSKHGIGPPCDEEAVTKVISSYEDTARASPQTLDAQGGLTDDSVRFIMTALQERDAKLLRHPAAPGGDHSFAILLELVNDKGWVHGELVGLGALIIAWQCDESPQTLIAWLDSCRVRHRPAQMGISREELRKGLEFAPTVMSEDSDGRDSIMGRDPVVGHRFDALWEFLGTK